MTYRVFVLTYLDKSDQQRFDIPNVALFNQALESCGASYEAIALYCISYYAELESIEDNSTTASNADLAFSAQLMNSIDELDNETLTLTKLETEIFQHRLEVPDAIAEAIDTPLVLVEMVCELMIAKNEMALYWLDADTMRDVAVDAIEGSTWLASMSDESSQKIAAHERAYLSLLGKVQQASTRLVDCAPY